MAKETPNEAIVRTDKARASLATDGCGPIVEAEAQGWGAKVFEENKAAVVAVHASSSSGGKNGTGFIISNNGYLLTNEHVVFDEEIRTFYSKTYMSLIGHEKQYKIEVLFSDKKTDIALCKFDPKEVPNFTSVKRISDYSKLLQGADCLVIGNAFGMGLAPFMGIIRFTKNTSGNLVYTAPSNPGDSGGPVFNRIGECIGINKSKTLTVNGETADSYANATPMDVIDELLKKWVGNSVIEDEINPRDDAKKVKVEISEEQRSSELCQVAWNYYQLHQYKEAFNNWYKAAELGNEIAKYNVGWCYENECYVTYDIEKAIGYYVAAADLGNEEAKKAIERIKIKRGQEQADTITPPSKYPTLQNYDRREFDIVGTTLKKYNGSEQAVIIPYGVEYIGCNAFSKLVRYGDSYTLGEHHGVSQCMLVGSRITSVEIPDTVTVIDKQAFHGCSLLMSVVIPNSVVIIGKHAFSECSSLTSVFIGSNVTSIGDYAFNKCSNLTSVHIGKSVESIGSCAFLSCDSLVRISVDSDNEHYCSEGGILYDKEKTKIVEVPQGLCGEVKISNGVVSIVSYQFQGCRITRIDIPSSVTSIHEHAFCGSLTYISVDRNNTHYSSEGGILYNKEKTKILHVPIGLCGEVKIPTGVTSINKKAFCDRRNITSIEIPFSVTSIGEDAFGSCCSLVRIIYHGNKANWKNIIKDNDVFCRGMAPHIPDNCRIVLKHGLRIKPWDGF